MMISKRPPEVQEKTPAVGGRQADQRLAFPLLFIG
jgi:hypothetical protein